MEIIKVTADVNSGYNPDTSYNGGGYFQPSGTATVQTAQGIVTVLVNDTSCGDFGSRIGITVHAGAKDPIMFCIGSMDGAASPDWAIDEAFDAIADATGDDPVAMVDMAIDAVREEAYRVWCKKEWDAECR